MHLPRFFIDRPIFAAVLSIVITLLGALAFFGLPISQYPDVIPPTVVVTAQDPGEARARVALAAARVKRLMGRHQDARATLRSALATAAPGSPEAVAVAMELSLDGFHR